MARRLGSLSAAERAIYDRTLTGTHHREVEVEVYRLRDGKAVTSLTNRLLGGSIQGDEDRTPVTFMECDILDEDYVLDWSHGEHRRHEVQVMDSRFIPDLDDWVVESAFRGPIWDFERSGVVVSLTAEGPEKLAEGSIRRPDWWPAKTRATEVIKALLKRAGAKPKHLRIPNLKATLPGQVTVGVRIGKPPKDDKKKDPRPVRQRLFVTRGDTYWGEAKPIAGALNRDLFADNHGRFLLAHPRTRPTISLDDRTILTPVAEKRGDEGELTNVWIVTGPNPKGPRNRPRARVELPRKHPASARSRRWGDTDREVIEAIDNPNVKTDRQARKIAERRRDKARRELVTYQVSALPIVAWVRPFSLMSLPTGGGRAAGRIGKWTLPLGPGPEAMTLGAAERRKFRR